MEAHKRTTAQHSHLIYKKQSLIKNQLWFTFRILREEEQTMITKEYTAFQNKVWLSSSTMHGDELKYMTEAFETNWMSTVGKNINEVERIAAEKIGRKYAVALSSRTATLHLTMKLAAIKHGDKVIAE